MAFNRKVDSGCVFNQNFKANTVPAENLSYFAKFKSMWEREKVFSFDSGMKFAMDVEALSEIRSDESKKTKLVRRTI